MLIFHSGLGTQKPPSELKVGPDLKGHSLSGFRGSGPIVINPALRAIVFCMNQRCVVMRASSLRETIPVEHDAADKPQHAGATEE